jgi:hypothetical protein
LEGNISSVPGKVKKRFSNLYSRSRFFGCSS